MTKLVKNAYLVNLNLLPAMSVQSLLNFGSLTFDTPMSLSGFDDFCRDYPDLRCERDTEGYVNVRPLLKHRDSLIVSEILGRLYIWNQSNPKPGKTYSPSAGFLLAGEEVRCGDATWISNKRLIPFLADPDHKEKWVEAVPEFVVEVRSDGDRLHKLQEKMTDTWMANGVLLSWLIDPEEEVVYIYRQRRNEVEEVRNFDTSILSGEEVLPGFMFPLVELNL